MGTMLDLPAALRSSGLTVWVAPDWKTNGHGYDLITPFGGVLHHTAGYGLRAVYGEPDARPDVPQPRCNLWTPRPGTQPYDIAVVSAGRAWQAGTGRRQAYDDLKAGRFSAASHDAATRFGLGSDDVDGGWTSLHTLGNEVECSATANAPGDFTGEQLDVVATAMRVCVEVFDWPGLGCWAHHRQLTYRKPDMAYRGDIWSRARAISTGGLNMTATEFDTLNGKLDRLLASNTRVEAKLGPLVTAVGAQGDDEAKALAAIKDARTAILAGLAALPTAGLSDADVQRLGASIAEQVNGLDADAVISALKTRISDEPAA